MSWKQPLEIIYLLKTGRTSNLYLYQAALDLAQSKVSMDGILWPLQAPGAALAHSHASRHSLRVLLKFPFLCLVTTDSSFHCTLLRWKRLHHLYKPLLKNGQIQQLHAPLAFSSSGCKPIPSSTLRGSSPQPSEQPSPGLPPICLPHTGCVYVGSPVEHCSWSFTAAPQTGTVPSLYLLARLFLMQPSK